MKFQQEKFFSKLLRYNFIPLTSAIIRFDAIKSYNPYFDIKLNILEDWDLFCRIAYSWEVEFVDEVLSFWRVNEGSMTFSKAELIPIEKKRVLQKYKELFPNFNKKYKREIDFNEAAIAYDLSMQFLNEEKKKEAIEILAPFIDIRFKYKLFYFLLFLPLSFVKIIKKVIKIIRPDARL